MEKESPEVLPLERGNQHMRGRRVVRGDLIVLAGSSGSGGERGKRERDQPVARGKALWGKALLLLAGKGEKGWGDTG